METCCQYSALVMLHSAGQEWARADGDALHPAFVLVFEEEKSLKLLISN